MTTASYISLSIAHSLKRTCGSASGNWNHSRGSHAPPRLNVNGFWIMLLPLAFCKGITAMFWWTNSCRAVYLYTYGYLHLAGSTLCAYRVLEKIHTLNKITGYQGGDILSRLFKKMYGTILLTYYHIHYICLAPGNRFWKTALQDRLKLLYKCKILSVALLATICASGKSCI